MEKCAQAIEAYGECLDNGYWIDLTDDQVSNRWESIGCLVRPREYKRLKLLSIGVSASLVLGRTA